MLAPQKLANEILKINNLKTIADFSCTALCVLWYLELDLSDTDAINVVNDAINLGKIEKDCTVTWASYIKWLTGRSCTVDFIDIKSLKEVKGRAIVMFTNNGVSHWVGVENGKVVFDPLGIGNSKCVALGKPVTSRVINFI